MLTLFTIILVMKDTRKRRVNESMKNILLIACQGLLNFKNYGQQSYIHHKDY